jgi:hypothetical protein
MNSEDYQNIGLQLKRLLRRLNKFPAGRSAFLLKTDLCMSIDEIQGLIELALAADLISEHFDGDETFYKSSQR